MQAHAIVIPPNWAFTFKEDSMIYTITPNPALDLVLSLSHAWFGTIPKVKVKTTVDAGDSMVGAISAELWKRKILTRDAVDSLDLDTGAALLKSGLAAACATLTTHGTDLGSATLIRHYSPLISATPLGS